MASFNVFHNGVKIGSNLSRPEADTLQKGKYNCQVVEVISHDQYMASFSDDKLEMLERNRHEHPNYEDRDNAVHNLLNN